MLKPVSILALDDESAALSEAVQQRVAKACGLDDLVQWRRVEAEVGEAVQSIRAQRQRPDSPLRVRDDISTRELVLVVLSAAGPARSTLLETVALIRNIYETRRLASYFAIEILCLLPEVTKSDGYAAAYGLLKALSAAEAKPFGEVWLLDGTNGSRVQFGPLPDSLDTYADAVAGALTFEAEMSGALPGLHPRGMPPLFSSFGYAELFFPRDLALQRVESRFTSELVRRVLLKIEEHAGAVATLEARKFMTGAEFTAPAAGSVFKRFQPKTLANERTRSADELIAAVRNELKAHRESVHLQSLDELARKSDQAAADAVARLEQLVDGTLDNEDYPSAIRFLDALLDPLPDVRSGADAAPRNLVTEINAATAALDARIRFVASSGASDAARKRVRELATLLEDQRLVADTLPAATAEEQLGEMEREQSSLMQRLPEIVFAEEKENNAARSAARESEAARLAAETEAREQELRELFAQRPRAEQALREALEARRGWIWRQIIRAAIAVTLIYGIPYAFGVLEPNLRAVHWTAAIVVSLLAAFSTIRYFNEIAPRVRAAREALQRIRAQIDATDKAKNSAHDDELQFEYDVAHRRASLNVLRRTREGAKALLDDLRNRLRELEELASVLAPSLNASSGLSICIIEEADVDGWYDRTAEERNPFIRELPIRRSDSRRLAFDELRARTAAHAATAFVDLRGMTIAGAATVLAQESKVAQRLKRFAEISAPLIELRDDDLPAHEAMQRDTTLWSDAGDRLWIAQLQRRFPDAQSKPSHDPLRVHALSRVLHFPAYVLGQVDYYRARYEAANDAEFADVPDLLPTDLLLTGAVRMAYEQVLLGRALGVIAAANDGTLTSQDAILGDSHLAAARHLVSAGAIKVRQRLHDLLEPRLAIVRDVERDLRQFQDSAQLTALDQGILGALLKRYSLV
jgi:hypothetical protein